MDFYANYTAINLLVVFGATLAANLLGGLWYSPILFGRQWRAANALGPADGAMGVSVSVFIASFILFLISATLLALLLGTNAGGMEGLQFGALIGFAFVLTAMGATNLFEGRSLSLILINAGYHVVALSLMGYIIGRWG